MADTRWKREIKAPPPACSRYHITALELTGLLINIMAFKNIISSVSFETYVDHSALIYLINGRTEPLTQRIKKLLEKLSAFSFKLGYMKGSDLLVTDYLSRSTTEDNNPSTIVPISFGASSDLIECLEKELHVVFFIK